MGEKQQQYAIKRLEDLSDKIYLFNLKSKNKKIKIVNINVEINGAHFELEVK
jgi:hypothetical protein